jgi:hypothetical protein
MTRIWTIVCYSCFALAVVGMAAVFTFSDHYGHANPTTADPRSGRIHSYNYKGRVVYLNEDELLKVRMAEGALYIGALGFAVGGSLAGWFRVRK